MAAARKKKSMADSTGSFRASFVLALKDDLSAGLRKIIADVKSLKAAAQALGFKPLEGADAIVNRVDRDVTQLNRSLGATARQAETAAGAVRRMGAAELGRAREAARQAAQQATNTIRLRPAGGLMVLPAPPRAAPGSGGGGRGGGGGSALVPFDEPFEPRGGPIPLNFRRPLGSRLREGFGRVRQHFGKFSESVGLMGAAVAGISLEEPIRKAAELDRTLRGIAIVRGLHGDAATAEITRLRGTLTADSLQTGQPVQQIAEAYRDLINRGMEPALVDKLIPIHGRAATAYGVDTESMGQAVASLSKSLHIGEGEMAGALAAMAQATHSGTFTMQAMSQHLPTIAGRMDVMGMHGRGSLDKAAAALEVVSASSGDPGQTATNFTDMMIAMTQPYARKAFNKVGVDLQGEMVKAEKAGRDPMETYIGILERLTKNVKGDIAKAFVLGRVLHNQQAGTAALSLLQHKADYIKLRDQLKAIGADKLAKDFDEMMRGLQAQMMLRAATTTAIEQRLGLGFAWTVPASTALLGGVLFGMTWMDNNIPGVTDKVIELAGGMLGLTAVAGVLGTVWKPVVAGFRLLSAPIRLAWRGMGALNGVISASGLAFTFLAVLAVGAAIDIWRHWDRFRDNFRLMWSGLRQAAGGYVQFLIGSFTGNMRQAVAGLLQIWRGLGQGLRALWGKGGIMETLMTDFVGWMPGWGKSLADTFGRIMQQVYAGWGKFFTDMKRDMQSIIPAIPQPGFMGPPKGYLDNPPTYQGDHPATPAAPALRHPTAYRLTAPGAAAGGGPAMRGKIVVEIDDRGTRVRTQSDHPDLELAAPSRGRMLQRA